MTETVENFDDFDSALAQRAAESFARKDDTGKFRGVLKESEGLRMWRPGEGSHMFDIIPYRCGQHDPRLAENTVTYVLDIWVHFNVGATEDSFVCPARTYSDKKNPLHTSERCPICEHQNELRKELERLEDPNEIKAMEDNIKSLNPRRRVLYNVLVLDNEAEEEKGCQVWDVAHWSMERHLGILSEKKRGASGAAVGGHIPFASPKKGKNVVFTKKGKGMQTEFIGHRFQDREPYYEISQEMLQSAKRLDEEIIIPSYDDLYIAYHGVSPGEALPAQTSDRQSSEKTRPIEDDIPSDGAGGQARTSGRQFRTSAPVENKEDAPLENKEPAKTEPSTTTETKSAEEVKDNRCPMGGVFGRDEGKLSGEKGCRKCPDETWQACAKATEAAAASVATTNETTDRKLQRAT